MPENFQDNPAIDEEMRVVMRENPKTREWMRRLLTEFPESPAATSRMDATPVQTPAPSNVTSPEIQLLEAQLNRARQDAALRAGLQPGELREVTENDRAGRPITRFFGDFDTAFGQFKGQVRAVVGINGK
jgi:hypothetical protein